MSRRLALFVAVLALGCGKPKSDNGTKTPEPAVTPPVTAAPDSLPDAEGLLTAAVEASGGAKAYEALGTYYSEARMEMPQQGLSFETHVWWDHGKYFMEVDMPGVGKSRVWSDGQVVTSEDPINGRRVLEGREANQARWSNSVSLPLEWKKFFDTAETIGRREQDGKQLLDVKLSGKDGDTLVLSFDESSHLLAAQRFEQHSPQGMLPVEVAILEYKEIAGLKQPVKSELRMAIMSMSMIVTKFEPNAAIDPKKLEVPPPEPHKVVNTPAAEPGKVKGKKTKGKAKDDGAAKDAGAK